MVHLFHASQVIRIANSAYFHAKFSPKALALTFGVKSHLTFIHHRLALVGMRCEKLSLRSCAPTPEIPKFIYLSTFRAFIICLSGVLNYCPGVMKCEERSLLKKHKLCVQCERWRRKKVLNFSTCAAPCWWIRRFYYSRFQFTHKNLYVCTQSWKPHMYTTAHRLRETWTSPDVICSEDSHSKGVLHFGSFAQQQVRWSPLVLWWEIETSVRL